MTDTDWLTLADFLDAHANDMRAWTEDEPKFRATAEGLRQLAAITAERDAAVARAAQLGTGIDSVRSHWHADEGPRWTANVIEALRHSGLMDDVMLSGTPDPDTDPNTLADDLESHVVYFERHKDDSAFVVTDTTTMLDTMRAAAVGLRQLDAITAAIGDLHRPMWDDPTAPGFYQTEPHREGDPAIGCCTCGTDGWPCPTAASLSPTPTPERCPQCGSTNPDGDRNEGERA